MSKFVYLGRTRRSLDVEIGGDDGPRRTVIQFEPGAEIDAPDDHPFVRALVAEGELKPAPPADAPKAKKTEAPA